jgi:hypothetical protein
MGYTFKIGNAEPKFDKSDFPHLSAGWDVKGASSADAPTFPNDEMTSNTSERSPSYSVWADFCRHVGIYDLFFDDGGRLHAGHPGCIGITKEDADRVTAALSTYQAKATLPPGFEGWHYREGDPVHSDAHLARLIWLEWWMRWALENCETPAIANY